MLRIQRFKQIIALLVVLMFLSQMVLPALSLQANAAPAPSTWADVDRNYRTQLSFNNSEGTEDLQNYPVLVKLDASQIDYSVTASNDLRFYSADQSSELPYEVEKWDPQGESLIWVKVPLIHAQSSSDNIWMYYGGSSTINLQPKQVWDPNYLLVYHFPDRIADYFYHPAQVQQYTDSTMNNNTGLRNATNAGSSGPSYTLDAKDPRYNMVGRYYESHRGYVRATNGNVGDGQGQITISAWVRANEYELNSLNYYVIARKRGTDTQNQAYFMKIGGGKWSANLFTNDADPSKNGSTSLDLDGGPVTADWTYLTLTYDQSLASNNLKLYRNGALVSSATRSGALITTSGTSTTPFTISKSSDAGAAGGGYRGGVDEVRVSKQARSAAWVMADYQSMSKDSRFVVFGGKETKGSMQLTLVQPKQGGVYYSPDLSFGGVTSDASTIRYELDNQPTVEVDSNSKAFQSMLSHLVSGLHTLNVEAVSKSDSSVRASKTVTFTIDGRNLSPTATTDGPNGSLTQASGDVTLRVKAESPTGDPVNVNFYQKDMKFVKDFSAKVSTDTAYERTDTMDPPSSATITSETALPASAYEQIKSTDGAYYSSKSLSNYPYQRFDLAIDSDLSDVNQLDVTWEGRSKELVKLYAWNYSTSKWILIASQLGNTNNSDFKLTGTLDKTTMVNSTTKVAKLYVAATQHDTMLPGKNPSPNDYDFSFVWMTDTQLEAESFPSVYDAETQWMADNKDAQKIQYVIHTGDIVNSASQEYQWQNADHSMKILENAGIPYGVIQGNHDTNDTLYSKYFGAFRFKDRLFNGKPYYTAYNSMNKNHYDLISAGGVDFIIMYMGWGGFDATSIAWANQVLQQYKDRKAILAVHEYLLYEGTYGTDDYDGINIMNQIVKPNSNVFMVLCGHNQSAFYNVKRIGGKVVYELLHDYQDAALGGAAYMRMMYFDLKRQQIYMVPYSPITNDNNGFFQQKHEFYTMPIRWNNEPIELATGYVGITGSTLHLLNEQPVSSVAGTANYVWSGRNANQSYTWYAEALDTFGHKVKSDESSYTIKAPAVQSIRLSGLAPMKVGQQLSSVVEATYSDGRIVPAAGYVLTSSNPAVATVDASGLVSALAEGQTDITARLGAIATSYRLFVQTSPTEQPILQSIQLSGLQSAVIGERQQSVVSAINSNNTTALLLGAGQPSAQGLSLTNSESSVAALDPITGEVTALKAGQTVITATYQALFSSYTLLVKDVGTVPTPDPEPKLESLVVSGLDTLKVGEKGQASVFGHYSDKQDFVPIQDSVQFTSSMESVATVNALGEVAAVSPGKSTITVRYKGLEVSHEVQVVAASLSPAAGGGGGGYVPAPVPANPDDAFIQKVDASQLTANSATDSFVVQAEKGKVQLELPYLNANQAKASSVAVQLDWGTVKVPVHALVSDKPNNESAFVVSSREWNDDYMDILKDLESHPSLRVKPAPGMIHLAWDSLAQLGPVDIQVPLLQGFNGKRVGLYRISNDGQLILQSLNASVDPTYMSFKATGSGDFVIVQKDVIYFDVKGHWAAEVIGDLAARNMFDALVADPIVADQGAQGFDPDRQITRAEFAALLARSLELPKGGNNKFADIPHTAWYSQEVASALSAGIVDGVSDSAFAPDAQITREQMAVMLMRAWKVKNSGGEAPRAGKAFADWSEVDNWAKEAVSLASAVRLMNGRADESFVPKGTATRAEGTQAIHNFLFGTN
ncbi:DUF2341 domain-containing protein [Paenibacillus aceris]|uniref:SLH domain-containing protein n=1 Tax=Paenibacillus aceris TaxID=869555 RepID=A0ABS4HWY8_9BACL|nr:DUF2341 domain-containing protein [Paenibacillus aceris]MBP1963164.1 hypothetical protein [Paenibacillus aceris]NHW38718.1 DUF2341 domain-containing protein [Paenibacillus aceris]